MSPEVDLIATCTSGILTVINAAANPFVFAVALPVFRRGLRQMFCSNRCGNKGQNDIRTCHQHSHKAGANVIA